MADGTPAEPWRPYTPLLLIGVLGAGSLPVVSTIVGYSYLYPLSPVRALAVVAVGVAYSAAVYAIARWVSGSVPAGVVCAIVWSMGVFFFPRLTLPSKIAGLPEGGTAVAYMTVLALVCVLLSGRRHFTEYLAVPLSLIASIMFFGGVLQVLPPYLHTSFHLPFASLANRGDLRPPGALPNIYHLVLDEMGRPDVLRARYGADLSGSESSLTELGFTVEGDAVANYAQTYLSIPSMLNADYVRVPPDGVDETSEVPLHDAIQHNAVFSALRQAGYQIEFLASDYSATADNIQATICQCSPTVIGEFESDIVYRTPFRSLVSTDLGYLPHRNRVEDTLEAFAAAADSSLPAPHYTFGHVLSPHPPFIFKADGTLDPPHRAFTIADGSLYPGTDAEYRAGYAQQAEYILRRAAGAAAALVARDPTAVIIISGDHGPRLGFSAVDPELTDATEVLPVFLAIRWGRDASAPVHVHTLVNVYRAVLNRYLGTTLPVLPTHSYVSSFVRQYDLLERAVR